MKHHLRYAADPTRIGGRRLSVVSIRTYMRRCMVIDKTLDTKKRKDENA